MSRTYLRVPLVQRLEYLHAFLTSYKNNEFDEKEAQRAIQKQIHYFEVEKAKALGRKRPRMRQGTSTLQECLKLARHLGLIDHFKRLTPKAQQALEGGQSRSFFLGSMWQIYPRFRQVVLAVRDAEQLNLSFYARGKTFRQEASSLYGFEFDRLTLETIRNLATQLALINWYPTKERRQIIYPVASVVTFTEIVSLSGLPVEQKTFAQKCCHQTALDLDLLTVRDNQYEALAHMELKTNKGYLILQTESDQLFIKDHDVSTEEFEQVLWQEYLGLSSMRPRFPVLYPNLRNRVCAALRISDRVFDRYLLFLIGEPQRVNIYPSGGVLNYAANLAHLGKFLPPKTSQGNFIIYLKIDRRSAK
jgi:hypothetical protein